MISIITCVYNQSKYILQTILSVLDQTYKNFEYIILDDGSIDATTEIIKSINDPRVKLIRNEKNLGLTKSLNIALSYATRKYIVRLDGDDIMVPNRLAVQLKFMNTNPEIALCGSRAILINEVGSQIRISDSVPKTDEMLKFLLWDNCLIHSSVIFRKKCIEAIGGYNENYVRTQDYNLWVDFIKKYSIACLPYFLIGWRDHSENISTLKCQEQQDFALQISLEFLRYTFPELINIPDGELIQLRKNHMQWFRSKDSPKGKEKILIEIKKRL